VLRGLGLEQRMRKQSFYPRSWNNTRLAHGEVKFDMIFGESAEAKFGAPYLLAHRGDLHAALCERGARGTRQAEPQVVGQ
jgi:salicylate hydroxylase/6-hydroxynicotinate 3-monooxygenase